MQINNYSPSSRLTNLGLMLGLCLRRWPNIMSALVKRPVFAGRLVSIVGSLRDREVACSASDRQGSNFESCVWRTVSSQSSHHPQEVLLAQFSLYVHKGGLKPDSFHFIFLLGDWVPIFSFHYYYGLGGNPHVVVKAACLESRRSRVRPPLWLQSFKGRGLFHS